MIRVIRASSWRTEKGSAAWALAPTLLVMLVLAAAPLTVIVIYSFLSPGDYGAGVKGEVSVESYLQLLFQHSFGGGLQFTPVYLNVFLNSILLAGATTLLCVLLAFPTAVWVSMRSPRTRTLLLLLITIPFWTNVLVRTYAWMTILSSHGILNGALGIFGIGPVSVLYTNSATLTGLTYSFLPFMLLPIYSTVERFDFRLAEAAYDLGASRTVMLRRVLIPAVLPGVLSGCILVFIPALGSYLQPELLGGGRTLMVGELIAQQFGQGQNWPLGAALAVVVLVATFLTVLLASRRRKVHAAEKASAEQVSNDLESAIPGASGANK